MKSRAKTPRFARAILRARPLRVLQLSMQQHRALEVLLRLMTIIGETTGQNGREVHRVRKNAVVASWTRPISGAHTDGVDARVAVALGGAAALLLLRYRASVQRRRRCPLYHLK